MRTFRKRLYWGNLYFGVTSASGSVNIWKMLRLESSKCFPLPASKAHDFNWLPVELYRKPIDSGFLCLLPCSSECGCFSGRLWMFSARLFQTLAASAPDLGSRARPPPSPVSPLRPCAGLMLRSQLRPWAKKGVWVGRLGEALGVLSWLGDPSAWLKLSGSPEAVLLTSGLWSANRLFFFDISG